MVISGLGQDESGGVPALQTPSQLYLADEVCPQELAGEVQV